MQQFHHNHADFDTFYRQLTFLDVQQALHTFQSDQCSCCHLLRTNSTSRSFLPLARRGRPYPSSRRSTHLLCSNCVKIKHQQQNEILKFSSRHNYQYYHSQIFVSNWKINTSDDQTIHLSYSTDKSLTETEKKLLIEETIKKLELLLNNRSRLTTNDQNQMDLTYQTMMNILSSSKTSL